MTAPVPVYMRIGDNPERHVGYFVPDPEHTTEQLAALLRDAAHELDQQQDSTDE